MSYSTTLAREEQAPYHTRPLPLLDVRPDAIPNDLRALRRWSCWRAEPDGKGRLKKRPYTPEGRPVSVKNARMLCDFNSAFAAHVREDGVGVGFTLQAQDGLLVLDLDNVFADGVVRAGASKVLQDAGSYAELSPSGKGAHVWLQANVYDVGNRRLPAFEAFTDRHFVTVTGHRWPDAPDKIANASAELLAMLPARTAPARVRLPDDVLLWKAKHARNRNKFCRLWDGDWSGYPSQSEADLALCRILAFWCNNDAAQIDRLFRQSGLYRAKWDTQEYRDLTLQCAIESQKDVGYVTGLTPERQAILKVLREAGHPLRPCDVASVLAPDGPSRGAVKHTLPRMVADGTATRQGNGCYTNKR